MRVKGQLADSIFSELTVSKFSSQPLLFFICFEGACFAKIFALDYAGALLDDDLSPMTISRLSRIHSSRSKLAFFV